jgi:hypothetical protein
VQQNVTLSTSLHQQINSTPQNDTQSASHHIEGVFEVNGEDC